MKTTEEEEEQQQNQKTSLWTQWNGQINKKMSKRGPKTLAISHKDTISQKNF